MKLLKRMGIFIMSLVLGCTALSAFACGGGVEIDNSKTQVTIGYKAAGFGDKWMENAAKMFEEKFAEETFETGKKGVQIHVVYAKDEFTGYNFYQSYNSRSEDMYVGADINVAMYNDSHLYKLDDLVDEPLEEFGETKSIREKLLPWAENNAQWENGVWSIGTAMSLFGLSVYDYDLFEEQGFFLAEGGGYTTGLSDDTPKSKGFDGIAGTYDDGMPVTETEYFNLLALIKGRGIIPVTFTGPNESYATAWALLNYLNYDDGKAQDIWNTGYGEYVLVDENGNKDATATTFNGAYNFYENARFPGKLASLKIAERFVKTKPKLYSNNAFNSTQTHIQAQNEFLYSKDARAAQRIAMIWEGCWWETEADEIFTQMAAKNSADSKQNRRFGIMPPIKPDGNSATKHTYMSNYGGAWIPQKTAKDTKKAGTFEACKKFLKMLASDEFINMYTKTTNVPTAYNVEYDQEVLDSLTFFGKQLMEIAKDENNTHKISVENRQWHPAFVHSVKYPYAFQANPDDRNQTAVSASHPVLYFYDDTSGATAESYFASMYTFSKLIYSQEYAKTFGDL